APVRTAPPGLLPSAIVTVTPGTTAPLASRTCTLTAGVIVCPIFVLVGRCGERIVESFVVTIGGLVWPRARSAVATGWATTTGVIVCSAGRRAAGAGGPPGGGVY